MEAAVRQLNRYPKSAGPNPERDNRREYMTKYSTEFKKQALLLLDKIGVKKAAGQLEKAKDEWIASDKTPLNS